MMIEDPRSNFPLQRSAAHSTRETTLEAYFEHGLADQGAAAREELTAEILVLLDIVRDPDVFERRLFTLARRAEVLDGVQLAQLVQAWLPKNARTLRSAGRRVVRRLHESMAFECYASGYVRRAAMHLVRGALLNPSILIRRRSIGILAKSLIGNNTRENQTLQKEVPRVFRLFSERGVRARLFGSLAISVHAGRFVKRHHDIDLILPAEADTNKAVTLLVDELKYRIVCRQDWTGINGKTCFHVNLHTPSGIPLELSYLPDHPVTQEHIFVMDGVPVHTMDLRGLRKIYALFLVNRTASDLEKQGKKSAILTIDRLLSSEGT